MSSYSHRRREEILKRDFFKKDEPKNKEKDESFTRITPKGEVKKIKINPTKQNKNGK